MITTTLLMIVVSVAFSASVEGTTCNHAGYKKVGCFKRNKELFTNLLITDLDPTHDKWGKQVKWNNLKYSLHSLACRCHEMAKKGDYSYFAIGFYGECWAGKNTKALKEKIINPGEHASSACIGGDYGTCDHASKHECAGVADNEYVYEIAKGLVGTWKVTFDSGSKATYKFNKDGAVTVPYCSWRCPKTHSKTEVSGNPDYPSSEGWKKVNAIHRTDIYIYVRVKDKRLEVKYFSKYYKKKAASGIGERRSELIGTWDTIFDTGSNATYTFNEDGTVTVPSCSWRCPVTDSLTEESDNQKYPSSEGWKEVNKIHRKDGHLYVRVKNQRLVVKYYSKYYKNKPSTGTGKRRAELIGTWKATFDTGSKATYVFNEDGTVTVSSCSWRCPVTHSVIDVSDNPNYPSIEGWKKVAKIHRTDGYLYVRVKDKILEVKYFSKSYKKKPSTATGTRQSNMK